MAELTAIDAQTRASYYRVDIQLIAHPENKKLYHFITTGVRFCKKQQSYLLWNIISLFPWNIFAIAGIMVMTMPLLIVKFRGN
jgi:hypothetical protein